MFDLKSLLNNPDVTVKVKKNGLTIEYNQKIEFEPPYNIIDKDNNIIYKLEEHHYDDCLIFYSIK